MISDQILIEDHASLETVAPTSLPIIDFAPFLSPSSTMLDKLAVGKQLVYAFHEFGFIYLKNFGVDQTKSDSMFKSSKAFFDLTLDEKLEVEWLVAGGNHGYVPRKRTQSWTRRGDRYAFSYILG